MWKRLDEDISLSERHAALPWQTLGVWMYILPNADTKGRYSGDAKVVKARCMTLRDDIRLEQVEEALVQLTNGGLIHRYDVGGKRYLVLHQYEKYNPSGNLKYQDAKFPDPPAGLCSCVGSVSNDRESTDSLSLSHVKSTEGVQGEPTPPPEPPPKPRQAKGLSPQATLVSFWNDQRERQRITLEKGVHQIETAMAGGVPYQEIEQAVWTQERCKGKALFNVLDELRKEHAAKQRKSGPERDLGYVLDKPRTQR
jgi:hypothetical protein